MALFNRTARTQKPAVAVKAASGGAPGGVGSFLGYVVGTAEERALSIPTITRSRSLICNLIAGLDLNKYALEWNPLEEEYTKVYLQGEGWFTRPDPKVPRQFIMANTVSDLLLYGRAFWWVSARYSTGFPAAFTWLPHANVETPNQQGPQWWGMPDQVEFNGVDLDVSNVICFLAPDQGLLYTGNRAIDIAIRLDAAARRFALTEVAAGYLQQKDGSEPMTAEELGELASGWAGVRRESAIGALNSAVEFVEFKSDPSKMQLTEARNYAALEMSRLVGVPAYLVSAPTSSSMTYNNAQEQRRDLWLWGALPYATAIAERLSMDDVLPRGSHVEFDIEEALAQSGMMNDNESDRVMEDQLG